MLPRRRRGWASWNSGSPTLFRPSLRICPLCRFDQFEECTSVLAGPSTVPALVADSLASYIGIGSLPLARWWPGIAGEVSRGQACTTRASGQRLSLCPTPGTSMTTTTDCRCGITDCHPQRGTAPLLWHDHPSPAGICLCRTSLPKGPADRRHDPWRTPYRGALPRGLLRYRHGDCVRCRPGLAGGLRRNSRCEDVFWIWRRGGNL
jgi:hypothetical protein